jgi:hypothetical protein
MNGATTTLRDFQQKSTCLINAVAGQVGSSTELLEFSVNQSGLFLRAREKILRLPKKRL